MLSLFSESNPIRWEKVIFSLLKSLWNSIRLQNFDFCYKLFLNTFLLYMNCVSLTFCLLYNLCCKNILENKQRTY